MIENIMSKAVKKTYSGSWKNDGVKKWWPIFIDLISMNNFI